MEVITAATNNGNIGTSHHIAYPVHFQFPS